MKIKKPETIDQTITIRITSSMLKKLEAIAKDSEISISEVIRQMIEAGIKP